MEPTYYNRLTHWFFDKVNKIACKFGYHSFTWKLQKGETIKLSGPPPDRATCRYCGITYKKRVSKMPKVKAVRYHDFCAGHRVVGHESKCANLHGHNYRVHFHCEAEQGELDEVGRVIDFSVIKSTLCEWLENNWDHRMLLWDNDPLKEHLLFLDKTVVVVDFNPTAENMADYLISHVCPAELAGLGIKVTKIVIDETRKCSVTCEV